MCNRRWFGFSSPKKKYEEQQTTKVNLKNETEINNSHFSITFVFSSPKKQKYLPDVKDRWGNIPPSIGKSWQTSLKTHQKEMENQSQEKREKGKRERERKKERKMPFSFLFCTIFFFSSKRMGIIIINFSL